MVDDGEEDAKDLAEEKQQVSSEDSSGVGRKVEASTDSNEEQVLYGMKGGEEYLLRLLLPPVNSSDGEVGHGEPDGEKEVQGALLRLTPGELGRPQHGMNRHNHQV